MKTFLTLVIFLIFLLFGVGAIYLATFEEKPITHFLGQDMVRGSEVVVDDLPYTLNYEQQEGLIHRLNSGKKQSKPTLQPSPPGKISKIVFYQFGDKPDITLKPMNEDFSLFSVSNWEPTVYLEIKQPKQIKALLESTYDH